MATPGNLAFSLVYISRLASNVAPEASDGAKDALSLLQMRAASSNRQMGISGLLFFADPWFVQWLEGEEGAVRALMARIKGDPFHIDVQVVYSGTGLRLLDTWSMCIVGRVASDLRFGRVIEDLRRGKLPHDRNSTAAAVMRLLAMPSLDIEIAQRRVGLIGQTGIWVAALMAHLADRWNVRVERTRILTGTGFDRDALIEYVDGEVAQYGSLRVVGYSAEVLSAPWMRGMVQSLDAVVLFCSGQSEQSVVEFIEASLRQLGPANAAAPLVCLFGRNSSAWMPSARALLSRAGRVATVEAFHLADSSAAWATIQQHLPRISSTALLAPLPPNAAPKSRAAVAGLANIARLPQIPSDLHMSGVIQCL